MWLPRFERFLKVTHLLEAQHQSRPMIFGETTPSPRVQVPIAEVLLVAMGVPGHSLTSLEPFLVDASIAGGLVTLRGIVHYLPEPLGSDFS